MKIIWKSNLQPFDTLNKDINCDVAIIGGGIAGLWCAYKLVREGRSVCVLEANRIGSGVTAGSTAILTYAQDIIYDPLIKKHGLKTAEVYLKDTKNAIKNIQKIIKDEKFDCDLENIDFVLFTTKGKGKRALHKEKKAYEKLGERVIETEAKELPYRIKKALYFKGSLQFNPLKLCEALAGYIIKHGGQIFEKTMVTEAPEENRLLVGSYRVQAQNFVVATHYPYINFPGFYFLKMYQSQNYAIGFKPDEAFKNFAKNTSYESVDETGFEYRRVGKDILCDGADVRTGQKQYHSKYQILEKHLAKYFGVTKDEQTARYVAQDCITLDKLPYAGLYSHFANNVFVVSGFNKWGMTNSYITSDVVCNIILGKLMPDSPDNIYAPQRNTFLASPIQAVANIGVIAGSWMNKLLNLDAKKFRRIQPGQGAIIKYKGKRIGASRDADGKLHMISGICPHLGCNLKWNKDECTFDCPCHGSRFDTQGNIINNPAIKPCEKIR